MISILTGTTILIVVGIVLLCIIGVLLETENQHWASFITSVVLGLVTWHYKADIWVLLTQETLQVVLFVFAYLTIGIFWSIGKWTLYVKNSLRGLNEAKKDFLNEFDEFDQLMFINYLTSKHYSYSGMPSVYANHTLTKLVDEIVPKARRKKSLIISWLAYWPVSFVATILNDPFRRFFEWLFELISNVYSRIENYQKRNILN